jgi:N-acyl-D-aspartate/D-glutamate deacylase
MDLGKRTGAAIMLPLEPFSPRLEEVCTWLDSATESGITMFGQTHGRGFLSVMSFKTALPFDGLPEWSAVRRLPLDEQRRLLEDDEVRRRLVAEVETADDKLYSSVGAAPRRPNFDLMCILDDPLPPYRSVASLAQEQGVHPVDLIIDLGLKSNFGQFFVQPFIPYSDEDVLTTLKHQRSVLGLSDTGAHVSQLMDSSIPTHLLAYWVRTREQFTMGEAVRMLTAVPAAAWGIPDRGFVRENFIADLNVIDPAAVQPAMPEVVQDLPAGATRLTQGAHGFRATVVAGEVVHEGGVHTGRLPGRLIRGPFTPTSVG